MAPDSHNSKHIRIRCECGKVYRLPIEAAGRKAKCACGRIITIPATPPEDKEMTNQQNTPHDNNTSEVSYRAAPDGLRHFFEYQQFDCIMRQYTYGSIFVAIILGILICVVLLGPGSYQEKISKCQLLLLSGIMISIAGGAISGKKVPNAIDTAIWGCYFILTGEALTQMIKVFGLEEFSNSILLLATLFVIIGLVLIGIAIRYMLKRSLGILLAQGICFALLSIIHIGIFLINIFTVLSKGTLQNIFIGLWLAVSSATCFLFYRKFRDKSIEQPTQDTLDFVNRIIQEAKTSLSENSPGIIEITGGGPRWVCKLWANSLMLVVDDDKEDVYFVRKSDFKLVKRLTSKKKRASGFIRIQFKIARQKYIGEVSEESYHRYQKWKTK